jgi:hypothetical protein
VALDAAATGLDAPPPPPPQAESRPVRASAEARAVERNFKVRMESSPVRLCAQRSFRHLDLSSHAKQRTQVTPRRKDKESAFLRLSSQQM